MKGTLFLFIPHPSAFILALEPVAQMDESTGLRSLRAHVRVVPGSFADPGSSKGRTPVFETGDEGSIPSPGVRCVDESWRRMQRVERGVLQTLSSEFKSHRRR